MNHSPYARVPTFSQRRGLREMPDPPQLEEISGQARNYLWGALWKGMEATARVGYSFGGIECMVVGDPWRTVFAAVHQSSGQPLDEFDPELGGWRDVCKQIIQRSDYNVCFDFLQMIMRQPPCPRDFTEEIKEIFHHQLAYRVDTTSIPEIVPAATPQEGDALIGAIQDLSGAGLGGAATHLRQASARLIQGDWAGSVRASVDAIESVAKQVAPEKSGTTLGKALAALGHKEGLHGSLKSGFSALYGYASAEPGVRHALLEDESKVTQDEAIYMIGACAAFCSYLWRKFGRQDASSPTQPTP